MSVMITEVFQALRAIDVPEDLAARAAEAVGQHHDRLAKIEGRLQVLEWMVGTSIVLSVGLFAAIWTIFGKLADVTQALGELAGRLH